MKFILMIDTDNAAFGDSAGEVIDRECCDETARILRDVADRLASGQDDFGMFRTLRDVNGNDVGRAAFKPYGRIEGSHDPL